ncbi:hypothetical protein C4K88_13240 [Arthrobacter pityocampae]|uniref:Uncharacterized protein n=1 Tax=Arthrobacter pityocampae TaxID=547334 RepID=A0A2S5IVS3_9MICC|nr:hypothetical protein C4K88_13240 [Arthrobacter pityocampae]
MAVAVLLSILIPAIVGAAVRRGDRNGRAATGPTTDTGALFVVTNRRWQSVLFRVVGIVFLVIGGFFTLVAVVESEQMDGPGPLITGAGITVAGVLFVVLAMGIRRFRVEAFGNHLTVRPWFRATRVVAVTEIGSVRPSLNQYGGIDVRDVNGRMLFTATTISIGYHDIAAYLQERLPRKQTTNPAVPGDAASWQGATLRAESLPLPRGRKGTVKSGVRLTAGGVSGHMHTSELVNLLNHRIGIAESTTSDPLVFLCWPDSASPTSIVWEATKDLPADSLALLADPMERGPAAVLTGTELTDFSKWITALPR